MKSNESEVDSLTTGSRQCHANCVVLNGGAVTVCIRLFSILLSSVPCKHLVGMASLVVDVCTLITERFVLTC